MPLPSNRLHFQSFQLDLDVDREVKLCLPRLLDLLLLQLHTGNIKKWYLQLIVSRLAALASVVEFESNAGQEVNTQDKTEWEGAFEHLRVAQALSVREPRVKGHGRVGGNPHTPIFLRPPAEVSQIGAYT
jgi:hypothetical protein